MYLNEERENMWKFKKTLAVMGAIVLSMQGLPFAGLTNNKAKAASYNPAIQEIMSRSRPIVMGNQWHTTDAGGFGAGNDAVKFDFIGKYLDFITINRDSGSPNDLFIDFTRSIKDPNTGLLKTRNLINAAATKYGRKVYVLPYHNMTDVFSFQSVEKQQNDCWMKPDGQNIATWDYMEKNNYWLRKSDGTITSYPGYTNSQRRFWDARKVEVQDYWSQHAKGVVDCGFDGIFADNWLRSQVDHPDATNVKIGYNTMGGKFKQLAPDKILIGNSPPDSTYTTRDILMLEDRIDDAYSGDKSVPQYFKYSDQAAAMGQGVLDTYREEGRGDFKTFRVPMNLLTDNILGISTVTAEGTRLEDGTMPYLLKLGKVGQPKGPRYKADGVWQRDFTEGKVLFNDTSSSVTVGVPAGTYVTVDGQAATNITLPPLKGIVLKTTGTPPPAATVPSAPANVAVANVTKGATSGNYFVNLTWTDSANNETGFEIYQSIDDGSYSVAGTPDSNAVSHAVNIGTTPVYGTYNYKLVALNSAGKSTESNVASVKAGIPPVPSAPTGLTVTGTTKDSSGNYIVNLSWTDNSSNETGFEVYKSASSTSTTTDSASAEEASTSYTLANSVNANSATASVNMGTNPTYATYSFKVVATGEAGKSADSNIAITKVGTAPVQTPAAPSTLAVTNVTKGATSGKYFVNLTWKDNSTNETGFEIYQSFNNGAYSLIKTPASGATGYGIDMGTAPAYGTYNYKILAVNTAGKSADSNIATTKLGTAPVQTPVAPSNLAVTNVTKGATSGKYFVNLTWKDNSTNETGFEIYQSFNNGAYSLIKTPDDNATGYGVDMGTAPEYGTYNYKILAVGTSGKSADSNTATTKLGTAPVQGPAAPTNLTVASVTKGSTSGKYFVNLTWKDNSTNETGFEIYESYNNGAFALIKTPDDNSTSYGIDKGTAPAKGTYRYKIIAVGTSGKSVDSNIVSTSF
jgi:hypothetical protein